MSQAIVFLTHIIQHRRVLRHFARLEREVDGSLDAFLCIHHNGPSQADIVICDLDGARLLPPRVDEKERRKRDYNAGFTDLVSVPAMLSDALSPYEYIWLIEYDVDYAGNWKRFFAGTMDINADFLSTTIFRRAESPEWVHWQWFSAPPRVSEQNHFRTFAPIMRCSRRMLDCYVQAILTRQWEGHSEALFPTIAYHCGLVIEDLGGTGSFCPPVRRGSVYKNNPFDPSLSPGTFVYRPSRTHYFHEAPRSFPEKDFLYHPIKPARSVMRRFLSRFRRTWARLAQLRIWVLGLLRPQAPVRGPLQRSINSWTRPRGGTVP